MPVESCANATEETEVLRDKRSSSMICELVDWGRSALALARRPADGFVGAQAQPARSFSQAVCGEAPRLFPATLGALPAAQQPSRSSAEQQALHAAARALWEQLRSRLGGSPSGGAASSSGL